jgi:hypothetical protein
VRRGAARSLDPIWKIDAAAAVEHAAAIAFGDFMTQGRHAEVAGQPLDNVINLAM